MNMKNTLFNKSNTMTLKFTNYELDRILFKLASSVTKTRDEKVIILKNYFEKLDKQENSKHIIIGADIMDGFRESFNSEKDMISRAQYLCDTCDEPTGENIEVKYLWVEYPDGREEQMVNLIWK